jgi:tetratricopeptide (TPR) repeat protein
MAGNYKDPLQFWQELKQRKVVRAMTVYIAGAFALLQAVDMIFPRIGLPAWSVTLVIVLLAVGLIVVIILTWIYDITPEGIKRTSDLDKTGDEEKADSEFVLPGWESTVSQSREELISYNNLLYSKNALQSKRKGRIYSYSSFIVIIAVAVLFTFSSANTVPFAERDWVVITDFENLTNNTVFDKSLYTAFSLTANQSRYINILPRSRMLETMSRMKIKDRETVDDKTGREIAIREGIDIYIVPSISEVGNKYVIAAKIMDSKSGDLLRSEIINAENQDEILGKLDLLSKRLRRHLGESRYKIAGQDKPLKQVTTSSLEALKLYSMGIDRHLMMDFKGARGYYESALKVDTGFTSAKASLGNLLIEKYDDEKGRELLDQAVRSADKLTERERLGILTFHALNVEKNIPKGIEYAKMRIELYPDDAAARNNLGWLYMTSGQFEEALKEYKATVRIFPDMPLTYGGIEWIYLEKLGRIDSAMVWVEKMMNDNPGNVWGYFYLGSAYLGLDSLSKAETAFRKAYEINPDFSMNTYRLAHALRLMGRYDEAIGILKKVRESNQDEISALYDLGINYQSMGNHKEAIKYYSEYKKIATGVWTKTYPDLPETYFAIGAITARMSDFEASRKALQKAIEIDSTKHERFAELLCLQGRIPEALDEAEKALKRGYRDIVWLKINPDYQALQNEIRYRNLLHKYF